MAKTTLPLTVRNTGFLLDRLGSDCAPLQFVRELTQNSIEAISRASVVDGKITWDFDSVTFDQDGTYKLSISDNGPGMTGEEMIEYINSLSSSGSSQSVGGNYGVGAKIAAGTRNHHGLVYISWKAGKGSMIHLWRDPETGQYGLRQIERSDGTFGHYGDVGDDAKPEWITDHGTKVILLGNVADETTTIAPEGFPARDRWINKYLNCRYFRVPDGITISAREGMEAAAKGGKLGFLRHVYGQAYFLAKAKLHAGFVDLHGARAHWWIVKERHELQTEGPSYETTGHIAALYQNELYEVLTQRAGRARLQEFGVIFATNRVVIYVEPVDGGVTTNTARTRLIIDGEDLPWSDWAAEFREKIPREIHELMEEVGSKAPSNDHEKTIRERLKPLLDVFAGWQSSSLGMARLRRHTSAPMRGLSRSPRRATVRVRREPLRLKKGSSPASRSACNLRRLGVRRDLGDGRPGLRRSPRRSRLEHKEKRAGPRQGGRRRLSRCLERSRTSSPFDMRTHDPSTTRNPTYPSTPGVGP